MGGKLSTVIKQRYEPKMIFAVYNGMNTWCEFVVKEIKENIDARDIEFLGYLSFNTGYRVEELSKNSSKWIIESATPYAKYVEKGTTEHYYPFFYKNGRLTDLGEWAIIKLGWTVDNRGHEQRLIDNSTGKTYGGLRVNAAHPYFWDAVNRWKGKEELFIMRAVREEFGR